MLVVLLLVVVSVIAMVGLAVMLLAVVLLVVLLVVVVIFLLSLLPATRCWLPATDKVLNGCCPSDEHPAHSGYKIATYVKVDLKALTLRIEGRRERAVC